MKLKDYAKRLNEILNESPENGELEVVYAIDDEGNAFHSVWSEPTIGYHGDNDFMSIEDAKDPYFEGQYDKKKPNAICIN